MTSPRSTTTREGFAAIRPNSYNTANKALLGALDKKLREWLQLELKRIHRQLGVTFIYVTHDQEEALALSDRIAVFNNGRIEQLGSAEELYERPQTLFVAGFLGESNVFSGWLALGDGVPKVVGDGYSVLAPQCELAGGSQVGVVVRPERVAVHRLGDEPSPVRNILSGTIGEVVYLGASRKVEVVLDSSMRVTVREPIAGLPGVDVGERVAISWLPSDSCVLPDQRSGDIGSGPAST